MMSERNYSSLRGPCSQKENYCLLHLALITDMLNAISENYFIVIFQLFFFLQILVEFEKF